MKVKSKFQHIASDDQKGQLILPKGPDLSGFESEHNRKVLSNKEEKFLIWQVKL